MAEDSSRVARALYRTDAAGRCTYVNAKLCELFELSREEILDLGWTARIHPEDRERVMAAREKAIGPLPTFHIEYRVQLPSRTIRVEAFSTALMDGDVFLGRTGIITDLT